MQVHKANLATPNSRNLHRVTAVTITFRQQEDSSHWSGGMLRSEANPVDCEIIYYTADGNYSREFPVSVQVETMHGNKTIPSPQWARFWSGACADAQKSDKPFVGSAYSMREVATGLIAPTHVDTSAGEESEIRDLWLHDAILVEDMLAKHGVALAAAEAQPAEPIAA